MFPQDRQILTPRLIAWRRWTEVPLIGLALGSLPILLLEFVRDRLSSADRTFVNVVNLVIFFSFLIDYVVELFLTGARKRYVYSEWTSLLIVVSQGIALIPAFGFLGAARIFRGLRPLIFLFRIFAIGAAGAKEVRAVLKRKAVAVAFSVAGLVWLTSAAAFTVVEDVGGQRRVGSFGDALWWSATTISTVGYGDIYPVTVIGRVIAVLTTIVGVSTFGVVTAKLASLLIKDE